LRPGRIEEKAIDGREKEEKVLFVVVPPRITNSFSRKKIFGFEKVKWTNILSNIRKYLKGFSFL